jgi:1-acyl-sn-glycerol-3-phosphate acyltransferase
VGRDGKEQRNSQQQKFLHVVYLLCFWILKHSYEWQVAVSFGKVQTIANHKLIRDRKTKIIDLHFALASLVTKRRLRYMAKDSIWKNKPLGALVSFLGGFPVHRGAADREALRTCVEVIEAGEPLVMFPEGTRRSGPVVDDLFDGPAYVAAKTHVPVLPVGIGGSEAMMPKGSKMLKPAKLVLVIGEPLDPPAPSEGGRVSRRAVKQLTDQLRAEVQKLFDDAQARAAR